MLNLKYKHKYIKYKAKFLHLKRGGALPSFNKMMSIDEGNTGMDGMDEMAGMDGMEVEVDEMDEVDEVDNRMEVDCCEKKKKRKKPSRVVKKLECDDFRFDSVYRTCDSMFKVKLEPGQFKYGCVHDRDCYIGAFFSIYTEITPEQFRDISNKHPMGITDERFKGILKQSFNIDIEISEQILMTIREIYDRMDRCLENGEFTIITISPSQEKCVLKHIIVITKYEGQLVLIDRQDNYLTNNLKQVNVGCYSLNKYEYLGFDNIVLYLTSYLSSFLQMPTSCDDALYYQELNIRNT